MEYKFSCPTCGKNCLVEIPIDKYSEEKNKQRCPECGVSLRRVLEWEGPATINGGYEAVAGRAKWQ